MALEALLLSRDNQVLKTISRVLDDANIDVQVCSSSEDALQILTRHKYDTFVVDCDDVPAAPLVLQQLRKGKSNKSCIAFALVNGRTSVRQAFEMGANFVLDKPVSMERAMRSVKAAQGLIMRERRRYHEDAIKRKVKPPNHNASGQDIGWIDIEIVAGPDVQRSLLEEKSEPDGQQDLPQGIISKGPQEDALHQQAEDGNGQRGNGQRQGP